MKNLLLAYGIASAVAAQIPSVAAATADWLNLSAVAVLGYLFYCQLQSQTRIWQAIEKNTDALTLLRIHCARCPAPDATLPPSTTPV